jgi:hypothetical protein
LLGGHFDAMLSLPTLAVILVNDSYASVPPWVIDGRAAVFGLASAVSGIANREIAEIDCPSV